MTIGKNKAESRVDSLILRMKEVYIPLINVTYSFRKTKKTNYLQDNGLSSRFRDIKDMFGHFLMCTSSLYSLATLASGRRFAPSKGGEVVRGLRDVSDSSNPKRTKR